MTITPKEKELAAIGISVEAVREIRTPHHAPAPFTLVVLVGVVLVKEVLFRRVLAAGEASLSTALAADAWHHRSDAITSLAQVSRMYSSKRLQVSGIAASGIPNSQPKRRDSS